MKKASLRFEIAPGCSVPDANLWRLEVPDWCEPLDDPLWVDPSEATLMLDDDTVLGFEAVGGMWAIPWWVMKNHHVANLTLEGRPCLVTLCEYCVGGGLFDPVVDGRRLRFHVTGMYHGSPVMVDDATGSLWAAINAQPLKGPAVEIGRLPKRPIVHATWAEWRSLYPDTSVVHGEGEPRDGHGAEFTSPAHQRRKTRVNDLRLAPLDLVVGLELGDARRAYPLAAVHEAGGVIVDVVADRPVAVVAVPESWLTVTLDRELDGSLVALEWDATRSPAGLVDRTSGSRFDLWGTCVAGPHEGKVLRYVPSALKKWVVWAQTNPNSELWPPGGLTP